MALADVTGKLTHNPSKGMFRKYKNVYEFRDDMRQIWENCRLYNPIGQPVRTNGDWMSEYWEKKWATSGIEQKWEEEMLRQRQEEMRLAGGPELPHQMEEMDRELRMLQQQVEAQDGEVAAPGNRPMTFEEKRRLSQGLGALSGDKLGLVMEIIAESQRVDQEAEVEVDIDDLNQETLWRLNALVNDLSVGRVPDAGGANLLERADDAGALNHVGGAGPRGSQEDKQHGSAGAALERSREATSGREDSEAASDSQGEVGSKQLAGSTANHGTKVQQSHAGDGMDFVSATVPRQQPQIIKNMANKKEVTLQNANAWATLTEKPDDEGGGGDGEREGEEGEEGVDEDDNLWDQFKSLEQQQQEQEDEKKAEEERKRKEREAAEEAAAREAEERRAAAEAEAEALRAAEREKVEEQRRAIEEQRAREVAQLQSVDKPSDLRDQQELFVDGGNNALNNVFGLQLKGGEDSDGDFGEDDDDDAEDGEV
ncbi:hypothetical protein WJX75_000117 [Coccomyxa subellipsoidea]|uniref:Bromo domain-containing protein n=1 Tax=Coccomyxa subellipsoidea TaxID=248742 RepID=A0ABR2Z232_9CHLO